MANKTIDDLPASSALTGGEVVPVSQEGATVKTTAASIAALAPKQDHNTLLNLTVGDAHPQYLNQVRGDNRYVQLTRQITAGNGLSGGGDLSANRSFSVKATPNEGITVTVNGVELDINGLGTLPESVDPTNDMLVIWNASESRERKVSVATALAGASGFVPIDRTIIAGDGLTGGGDLSLDRTFAVGAGTGISVDADSVGLDISHSRNVDHSSVSINAGTGLVGGGTIAANRTISLDTSSTRNVDHSIVSITGVNSITGGGDLSASRTMQLQGDSASPGNNAFYGTNGSGIKGWYAISSVNIAWGQITGVKNADQLQGNSASAFATAGHTHNLSSLSGQVTNAQVPQSAVTQYQAALSIGWGQVTGTASSGARFLALGVGIDPASAGTIRATGNIIAFETSDKRFKENILPIKDALNYLSRIRGVSFNWTEEYLQREGGADGYFLTRDDVGVIAQEVENYFPNLVRTRTDGTKAVKYDKFIPYLIEAIKELYERVQELERA